MNGQPKEAIQWNQSIIPTQDKTNNKNNDEFTCLEILFCCWLCQDFNCWDDCCDGLCDDDD
jgi:hypothetical protein